MAQASRSWMTLNTSGRVLVFHLVFDVPPGREKVSFVLSVLRDLVCDATMKIESGWECHPLMFICPQASDVRDLRVSKIVRSLARRIDVVFRILDRCRYSTAVKIYDSSIRLQPIRLKFKIFHATTVQRLQSLSTAIARGPRSNPILASARLGNHDLLGVDLIRGTHKSRHS
jgi:hypothetical protein